MSCGQSEGKFILGKEKHRERNDNGVSGGLMGNMQHWAYIWGYTSHLIQS